MWTRCSLRVPLLVWALSSLVRLRPVNLLRVGRTCCGWPSWRVRIADASGTAPERHRHCLGRPPVLRLLLARLTSPAAGCTSATGRSTRLFMSGRSLSKLMIPSRHAWVWHICPPPMSGLLHPQRSAFLASWSIPVLRDVAPLDVETPHEGWRVLRWYRNLRRASFRNDPPPPSRHGPGRCVVPLHGHYLVNLPLALLSYPLGCPRSGDSTGCSYIRLLGTCGETQPYAD